MVVQTGATTVFTVQNVLQSQIFTITWAYQGTTLGLWNGVSSMINSVAQFQNRVTITANTLQIGNTHLQDAGTYTVTVVPAASSGLTQNSISVQLSVYGKSQRSIRGEAGVGGGLGEQIKGNGDVQEEHDEVKGGGGT